MHEFHLLLNVLDWDDISLDVPRQMLLEYLISCMPWKTNPDEKAALELTVENHLLKRDVLLPLQQNVPARSPLRMNLGAGR